MRTLECPVPSTYTLSTPLGETLTYHPGPTFDDSAVELFPPPGESSKATGDSPWPCLDPPLPPCLTYRHSHVGLSRGCQDRDPGQQLLGHPTLILYSKGCVTGGHF